MTYDEIYEQLQAEYDRVIADTLDRLKKEKPLTKKKLAKELFKANKAYWAARLALLDTDAVAEADALAASLAMTYAAAAGTFSDRVRNIYAGYQSAFDLSQKDAKELLKHVVYDRTIAENLKAVAEEMTDEEEKQHILAEISAPAYRYRLQRAEELTRQAKDVCDRIAGSEIEADRAFLQTQIEKAYNITVDEVLGKPPSEAILDEILPEPIQLRFNEMPKASEPVQEFSPTTDKGILDSFSVISDERVREIAGADWSGREFSESVWNNTDDLAKEIKQVLIEGELTGASEGKMSEKIVERFGVAMHKARRVVRTEQNYCVNQTELKGMLDAGYDEYEFASLGEEAEGVCDTCDDLDGMRFKIADAVVGVNCPPMHPFCRCKVTTPVQTEDDIRREIDERIESWNIPEGMSFDEFVERVNNGELEEIRKEHDPAQESADSAEDVTGKTIVEAEQKAEELGVRHVDYSDLPLETANTLNEAVNSLPPEARPAYVGSGKHLQEATGAKFQRSEKHYFGVHLDTQSGGGYFRFGEYPNIKYDFEGGEAVGISNTYKDLDKIPAIKEKYNADYAEKHDGHTWYFNTEDGKSVAFHEVGHVYADVKGIPDGFEQDAERWAAESKCDMLKNTNEAWAEAWGAYHTQNPNLPDYIAQYVHERTNTPLDNFGKSGIMNTSGIHAIGDKDAKLYIPYSFEPKVHKTVQAAFNSEYSKAVEKFGNISTIRGVNVLNDNSSDEGLYNDNSGWISLRHAEKKNGLKTMLQIAQQKHKDGKWSTAEMHHVMRHEIGHAIQAEHEANDPEWIIKKTKIFDVMQKAQANEEGYTLPSSYSANNIYEFMSECIAASYKKKPSKTVNRVVEIIIGGA